MQSFHLPDIYIGKTPKMIKDNDLFNTYDQRCKELFADHMSKYKDLSNFGFTIKPDCKFDGWFYSANSMILCYELKGRNIPFSTYKDSLLERPKYESLMLLKERLELDGVDYRILYINTFTDGTITFLDLTNYTEPIEWYHKNCNNHTILEDGKRMKLIATFTEEKLTVINTDVKF